MGVVSFLKGVISLFSSFPFLSCQHREPGRRGILRLHYRLYLPRRIRVIFPHPRPRRIIGSAIDIRQLLCTGSCTPTIVGAMFRRNATLDATRSCFRCIVSPNPRDLPLLHSHSRVARDVSHLASALSMTHGRTRVSGVRPHTVIYHALPHALRGTTRFFVAAFQSSPPRGLISPLLVRLMFPFQLIP